MKPRHRSRWFRRLVWVVCVATWALMATSLVVSLEVGRTIQPPRPQPEKVLLAWPATTTQPAHLSVTTRPGVVTFRKESHPTPAEFVAALRRAGWSERGAQLILRQAQLYNPKAEEGTEQSLTPLELRELAEEERSTWGNAEIARPTETPFRPVPDYVGIETSPEPLDYMVFWPGNWRVELTPLSLTVARVTFDDVLRSPFSAWHDHLEELLATTKDATERNLVREAIASSDAGHALYWNGTRAPPLSDILEDFWRPSSSVNWSSLLTGRTARHVSLLPFGFATLGVVVAMEAVRWRTRRKRAAGSCKSCGYDLRATPGRCPECGKVPA